MALPICTVALLQDYLVDALGRLAAWFAGDELSADRQGHHDLAARRGAAPGLDLTQRSNFTRGARWLHVLEHFGVSRFDRLVVRAHCRDDFPFLRLRREPEARAPSVGREAPRNHFPGRAKSSGNGARL
jgi:hypothetical protein